MSSWACVESLSLHIPMMPVFAAPTSVVAIFLLQKERERENDRERERERGERVQ